MRKSLPILLAVLLTGATIGCKDPSKSVPAAEVQAPAVEAEGAAAAEAPVEEAETVTETIALTPENTTIGFEGSKVTGSHVGGFKDFEGGLVISDKPHATTASVTIQMNSIFSDDDRLTEHLQSDDFFSVATYPTATFNITSINETANADGTHQVNGVLTMRGVERPIAFPAKLSLTEDKVTASAEFSINRKDWGILYEGKKDDLIRDGVILRFSIDADRVAQ